MGRCPSRCECLELVWLAEQAGASSSLGRGGLAHRNLQDGQLALLVCSSLMPVPPLLCCGDVPGARHAVLCACVPAVCLAGPLWKQSRPHPPRPPHLQLLACLRIIVSTADELAAVRQRSSDPLAGPINKENEEQALQTLQAALDGMLAALLRLPLLAGGAAAVAAAGSSDAAAAGQQASQAAVGVASEEEQVKQQGSVEQPHDPLQPAAAQAQQQQPQPEQAGCNENGFDADWRMSRHFCRVYLEGQVTILRRSLRECRDALAALQA